MFKYVGTCKIFCGSAQDDEDKGTYFNWYLEPEEITKNKIIAGLGSVGIECIEVTIEKESFEEGTRICRCVCYYDRMYCDDDEIEMYEETIGFAPQPMYKATFYVDGLCNCSSDYDNDDKQFEFCFDELVEM